MILTDSETKEFGYGGGAGGSKSYTGCCWITFMCLAYPGVRFFIGREELSRLRDSTYQTFIKVCNQFNITAWKYNGLDHYIQFDNGSRIDLLDLKYLPSDPYWERYGSIEYTAGWLEEASEVQFGAYDTLRTRIGRHNNDKYGILGKLFVTLNPSKNWCHSTFWKPFKAGTLPQSVKFLPALAIDNPFLDSGYIANLQEIKDRVRKQRLLYGNFDYDDSDNALMTYDNIIDVFSNTHVEQGEKYITADIARFGKDQSVIMIWSGWRVEEIHTLKQKSTQDVAEFIKQLQRQHNISNNNTICDEDGIGGGVIDTLRCKGFVNNSRPLDNPKLRTKENYRNLKSQCYFFLSDIVNAKGLFIRCNDPKTKELIVEELEQVKRKNMDKDGKLEVIAKDEVKQMIGRSPDYSDTIMMRCFFDLKPAYTWTAF